MDYAHNLTDKKLKALENKISREYKQAAKEAEKKLQKYLDGFKKQDEEWKKLVASGAKTKDEYLKWRQSKIAMGQRWKDLRDNLAQDMTNANRIAMSAVRGHMPEVYALNHNFGTFEAEKQSMLDTSYTLYDRQTVERLFRESPSLLPKPRVDIPKDLRWNRQKIQSSIVQGLLLGESMNDIAARMQSVTDMNRVAAIRNARTAVTSAENGGRQDSYKRAESMGIKMKKQWLASPDGRTRDSHREVDGETVGVNENFSNGLEFPGDPGGPPEEVYNCRCTMVGVLDKVDHDSSGRFMRLPKGQSYEEWRSHHKPQRKEKSPAHVIVNGKDITSTWVRREEKFDFEIEDVINAQGFDGLPRVVSADEFDKAVKESNFIAQRAYDAPDQETLNMYRDSLYHGKWYVDCSNGSSVYGKGMYCDARFGTTTNEKMEAIMQGYGGALQNGTVETFTLTKDAKILNYSDIQNTRNEIMKEKISPLFDGYNFSKEEKQFIYSQVGLANMDELKESVQWMSENQEKISEIYQGFMREKTTDISNIRREVDFLETSTVAVLKGYDAINCHNITDSGEDGYFIILNRTKCIFKGE